MLYILPMSDRYIISTECPYCGKLEDDVWYAPGCGSYSQNCSCGKKFFIVDCQPIKAEDVSAETLLGAFVGSLNLYNPSIAEQKLMLKEYRDEIKESILLNAPLH